MKSKGYYIRDNIIYVRGTIDGKKVRYSTGKKANSINTIWIEKKQREVLLKLHYEKTNSTLIASNKFIEFACLSLNLNQAHRKESTNTEYKSVFENYIEKYFKYFDIQDIKKANLLGWQNNLLEIKTIKTGDNLSIGRIRFIRSVFSGILSDAVDNDLINKNPFSTIKRPRYKNIKEEDSIIPFNFDEINRIISNSQGQYKNIFTLLFFTGIRTGEAWGLKWSDINFFNDTIHIKRGIRHGKEDTTKTYKSRHIDILPPVAKALKRQKIFTLAKDSYVFLNTRGKPFQNAQSISEGYWKKTLKFSGLDYRVLYQTRHSFASLMISQGEDVVWVSKMLGHSSIKMTLDKYTKYVPDSKRERASFLNETEDRKDTLGSTPIFSYS